MKKSHQHCPKVCSSTNRPTKPPAEAAGKHQPPLTGRRTQTHVHV